MRATRRPTSQSELDRQRGTGGPWRRHEAKLDDAEHDAPRRAEEQLAPSSRPRRARGLPSETTRPRLRTSIRPCAPPWRRGLVRPTISTSPRSRRRRTASIYQASSFREGQFVGAGEPLFSLVEAGDAWIDANFKETQLAHIATGQPAEVAFDIYPGRSFPATVEAIGAGTGAEFSLLPAQNATGNWVKVTQRVPVRLRLADAPVPTASTSSRARARRSPSTPASVRKLCLASPRWLAPPTDCRRDWTDERRRNGGPE